MNCVPSLDEAVCAPGATEPYQVRASSSTAMPEAKEIAIGRCERRRSRPRSMNGIAISTTMNSVGTMIVPKQQQARAC